jgi:hypothetical protein
MFLNIIYYDLKQETETTSSKNTGSLSFGPLYITPEQVDLIGFVSIIFI